jgi:hypothetical protein
MFKWSDFELHNEDRVERNRRQDEDFRRARLAPVHAGKESCPVGVSTIPGTQKPMLNYQRPE